MGERIQITPIALRNQKPTEIGDSFLELFNDHLHYKIEFVADEPIIENDLASGWTTGIKRYYERIARKENIAGLEKSLTDDGKWAIRVIVNGFSYDINLYYKTQAPATALFNKLYQWLYPK